MLIWKIICLFIGMVYTFTCILRAMNKNSISAMQIILACAGITGFIVLQFLI
jgi:hypothetical protein